MTKIDSRDIAKSISELAYLLDKEGEISNTAANLGIYRCDSKQSLTRMNFGVPTILLPVVGTKTVIIQGREFFCKSGQFLLLPEDINFDVINNPESRSARYIGLAIRFDVKTIELFHQLYAKQFDGWDLTPRWHVPGNLKLISAITNWIIWMKSFPTETIQIRHRMVEFLLLFAQQGSIGNLVLKQHKSWRHRVKELFLHDPAKTWRMVEICRRLGVSDSTLRRNLKLENIGFRDLLEEVRMEHGIGLVMESEMLISQISLACGYSSQSRFSERFKLRFSMNPTELRNTKTRTSKSGNVVKLHKT